MPETASNEPRCRARDLGISLGRYKPGRWNAITDVAGVRVGHSTVTRGAGPLRVGKGPVRTGVTAILPNPTNVFEDRVVGGGFVLNGAGEVSGMTQLLEWGLVETPIFLTNTLSVGAVSDAAVKWMVERYPGIGDEHDVIIPLVGECDDSWLNDIAGRHVKDEHVYEALRTASDGPVPEGSVGGGTGMITCDFKAGIGTSSRKLPETLGGYTVGVLVMSNFGVMRQLRIGGLPVGEVLEARYRPANRRTRNYGSIIAVIATDAPLITHQLNRLAKRAALGIGRVGSTAMHGSGEIVLAFSTANQVPRETNKMVYRMKILLDQRLDPLYEAVIEATEEAILNALCMARDMEGVNGNVSKALPLDDVKEMVTTWQADAARQAAAPPMRGRRPPAPDAAARSRTAPPASAAKPSAVRGAEGMARPARPPGAAAGPGATQGSPTRIERQDARSDSQEAKREAAEPRRDEAPRSAGTRTKDGAGPRPDGGGSGEG
ncbi:P1 family peptidase [Anaeromyxobacter dehalogenans]|uniref:L-aminopeptidase DmpA, Serine peptidase, MEROPS family S58 n=1 Tax=Anaeromyxobacter dehalogenans (strain 2CP-C) TaxID=290397 RepID=Q2IKN8_ANADE|nr:P1 family peptidase [Anaeromyxobacter dehalogenans]ABC82218.1 L-aminopeptidase DmpA, Serine peptidase, MEROPS family S58 [Anaeromyxobacter dehalogenans 2CP-C]